MGESNNQRENRRQIYLIIILLALITVAVYWQVINFQLVNFDDDIYIQNNPMVQTGLSPATIQYAFISPYEANWIPLVWISYMVDHDIEANLFDSGSPGIYHLTNALLHLVNVILLFLVLFKLTGSRWRSAFVAVLFAIHPLHVESVSWVSERKDVFSTLFWMLAMLAYLRYTKRPDVPRYSLVVFFFALGLMAKPMLVTLPIVLLLIDYWPLRRMVSKDGAPVNWGSLWQMVSEKMSLWVLAIAGCVVTIWAQGHAGAVAGMGTFSLGVRIANAFVAYIGYIIKMFWPSGLVFFYPHPENHLPLWQVVGSAMLFVGLTTLAIKAGRRRPYITLGWLWYVITLVPVIGIVQVGKQAMADRYTYIPLIGLFIIIAWGVPDLFKRGIQEESMDRLRVYKLLSAAASVIVIIILTVLSYIQVGYWRDSVTMCKHAINVSYANPMAHLNLGSALEDQGDVGGAIEQYRIAIKVRPDFVDAHYNLATILGKQGKINEAIKEFTEDLRIYPDQSQAHDNLGILLTQQGKLDEAIAHFKEALRIDPQSQNAKQNLEYAEQQKENIR